MSHFVNKLENNIEIPNLIVVIEHVADFNISRPSSLMVSVIPSSLTFPWKELMKDSIIIIRDGNKRLKWEFLN